MAGNDSHRALRATAFEQQMKIQKSGVTGGVSIVPVGGLRLPVPSGRVQTVRGGAIGGALGALAGVLLLPAAPIAIAILAGLGAAAGVAVGADADTERQS